MKKMPTIFERDTENRSLVTEVYHKDCQWVKDGEGDATKKYDGTCCLVRDRKLYKRREVKDGKVTPKEFELADFDPITKKKMGWIPVTDEKNDQWHREAFSNFPDIDNGTYELLGPKVQGNPESHPIHILFSHSGAKRYYDCPRDFDGLKEWFVGKDIEGIVFHHGDGRMAKIKKKDFGLKRKE